MIKEYLTKPERRYLINILNERLEELEDNKEVIEERFKNNLDDGVTYANNISNNDLTAIKVKRLIEKLELI